MPGDTLKQAWACKFQEKNDPSETLQSIGKQAFWALAEKKQTQNITVIQNLARTLENMVSGQLERCIKGGEATWTPTSRPAITAPRC